MFDRGELSPEVLDRVGRAVVDVIDSVDSEEVRLRLVVRYGPVRFDRLTLDWLEKLQAHRGREQRLLRAAFAQLEGSDALVSRLRERSPSRRLIALSLVGPSLGEAIRSSLADIPEIGEITALWAGGWLSVGRLPETLSPEAVETVREVAMAPPGTRTGPDPDDASKIARVVLAAVGHWDASELQEQALRAYDDPRVRQGHDAVACALTHPGLDQKQALADLLWENAVSRQGWRSHRKLNRVLRWAAGRGWIRMPWETP